MKTFIHVDVDNLWIYEKEYQINTPPIPPLIYTQAMPLALNSFEEYQISSSLFVIAKDLELPEAKVFFKTAYQNGHEICNHSYSHPANWGSLSSTDRGQEITLAHKKIEKEIGTKCVGFRAPGYYIDDEVLKILSILNYKYDSSLLPGAGTMLMKLFFYLKASIGRKNLEAHDFSFQSHNLFSIQPIHLWSFRWELALTCASRSTAPLFINLV